MKLPLRHALLAAAILVAACSPAASPPRPPTPATSSPPPPATSSGPAPAPAPAPAAEPLGAPGFLPVAPGKVIAGLSELTPPRSDEPGSDWRVIARDQVDLADGTLTLVVEEYPGEGAGLVILAPAGGGCRVINTYGVDFGGLGVRMDLAARWISPDRHAVLLLVRAVEQTRRYYAAPGDAASVVEPSAEPRWQAIGATTTRAWLAAPALEGYDDARFVPRDGSLRLTACVHGGRFEARELSAETLTFGPPQAAPGSCPAADRAVR